MAHGHVQAAADDGAFMALPAPSGFRFGVNAAMLASADKDCMYRVNNGRLYKAIPVGQEAYAVEISPDPEGRHIAVRYIDGGPASADASVRAAIAQYVREWLDLDTDLEPFYAMASADPLLKEPAERFYGLRNIGIPDLFEAISWGIIGQQINLTYAYTLKRRLVEQFGRTLVCEGETYHTFPTPETIAALSPDDLGVLRMTVKKCEYLVGVAALIAEGRLTRELLQEAGGVKEAERMLTAIRGIGPWTANYVLMRCLRMPSAFPIDDVGLHNAIRFATGSDRKPTKPEIMKLSAGWKGWESYATIYLWRLLY
jgi:DNA-3-methyladenine glycosylase II